MAEERFDVVVRGGSVASGHGTARADIGIRGGRVAVVADDLSTASASRIIDASGKLVLPGIIDVHNHPCYDDDMTGMSIAAAHGGVTTVVPFTGAVKAWGLPELPLGDVVRWTVDEWTKKSVLDFGLHMVITRKDDAVRQVPDAVAQGVISFKFFMAYLKRGMMNDDDKIIAAMDVIAQNDGMAMLHAENGLGIDYLEVKFAELGQVDNGAYLRAHTDLFEAESMLRGIALADAVRCPLYIVHVTVQEGMEVALLVKDRLSMPLYLETLPHYLLHTNDLVMRLGALGKIGPPIRNQHDQDALWKYVLHGGVDAVGTDHAGYTAANKLGAKHILEAKYGLPGIEHLLVLMYSEGVVKRGLDLGRMIQLTCENPARLFGLYPQKGALIPGADADLVVFNPRTRWTISSKNLHGNVDFTTYEGFEVQGAVELVMQRGTVLVENGDLKVQPGRARYLPARDALWQKRR
ncbi:MAG: amidohydrolase family protein [Chloroflexi bacterium]|nr:amidohydrolase family protein [Chloroflexota bacterium]MBI4505550.1 amidohydrolase family protein [Chloroflexota bacterium]